VNLFQRRNQVRLTVDDRAVREALAKLPERLNERARKNGIRRAMSPHARALKAVATSAPGRGRKLHRRAIASATKFDVRRGGVGPTAPLVVRLGVQYGRKGGARAKGRQRVFHLLEGGFRHYGSSGRYTNKGKAGRIGRDKPVIAATVGFKPGNRRFFNYAQSNLGRVMADITREVLAEARRLLANGGRRGTR